jgi:hypothetical protein
MTCAEFQEVLPELMEDRPNELEAHTASCPACAELVSDLEAIILQSKTLLAAEEPSPRVWNSIEIALRQEGLIREQHPNRPYLVPVPGKKWGLMGWLVPAMAVLALTAGILFMRSEKRDTSARVNPPSLGTVSTPITPGETTVPPSDDSAVLEAVQKRSPGLYPVYASNLKDVNAYIEDAKQVVRDHPEDDDARQDLLQAYAQKNMLYDMALERSLP